MLLQKAQVRLEELDHDCNELKLRRRDAEGSVEATIQALYRALEFMRDQDQTRTDDKRAAPPAAPGRSARRGETARSSKSDKASS